jgi:hypothetical protein
VSTELRSSCDLAQPFCDDVVHVAGFFRPNAPGRSELAGLRALSERQLLKSRGAYLAERVLTAVTPLEVVAIAFGPGALVHLQRVVWSRAQLTARLIPCRVAGRGHSDVALCVMRPSGYPRLEVAWDSSDEASRAVVDRLVGEVPA